MSGIRILLAATLASISVCAEAASVCYGTVANGRIDDAVQLPEKGGNFEAYSSLGVSLGRTFVHSEVAAIVERAYAEAARNVPDVRFVYGETGWKGGQRIRPHRTHQNGLSVDFMVPVRDMSGKSVPLPTSVTNKFGYDIDFDRYGKYKDLTIDFEAISEHLFQLQQAATARGFSLALVIFDEPYLPKLFATKRGPAIKATLPFMKGKPWIRHDEHYHVDFAVPCKPLASRG